MQRLNATCACIKESMIQSQESQARKMQNSFLISYLYIFRICLAGPLFVIKIKKNSCPRTRKADVHSTSNFHHPYLIIFQFSFNPSLASHFPPLIMCKVYDLTASSTLPFNPPATSLTSSLASLAKSPTVSPFCDML